MNTSITLLPKAMKNVFLSVISSITDPILSGIITVLLFLSLFWSVVLTILAFKYFIPIGNAKIRDGKTHARSERVFTDAELLSSNDNQLQYCINSMYVLFHMHEYGDEQNSGF